MCGAYHEASDFRVRTLARDGASLVVRAGLDSSAPGVVLDAVDATTLVERGGDPAFKYHLDVGGRSFTRTEPYGDPMRFVRFEPSPVSDAELSAYAGRYTSDEVLQDREIRVKDHAIAFATWGRSRGRTPLTPVKKDLFSGDEGLPFAVAIAFHRDARGHVTGFTMNGYRMAVEFRRR
jgi:hypothetical protein